MMDRTTFKLELDRHDRICAADTNEGPSDCGPQRSPGPIVTAEPPSVEGYVDRASHAHIDGWAFDPVSPDRPVHLCVLDNDVVVGTIISDQYRADLEQAGKGSGRHSFNMTFPQPLSPLVRHVIRVQYAADGTDLADSPRVLAPDPAAPSRPIDPDGPWRGFVDVVTRDQVTGWAWNADQSDARVMVQVIANDRVIARIVADQPRADLEEARIGDGRHGFQVRIPGGLSPLEQHLIHVRLEHDGADLPNSPQLIEPVSPAGHALRALLIGDHLPAPGKDDVALAHMAVLQHAGYALSVVAAEDLAQVSERLAAADIAIHGAPAYASAEDVLRHHAGHFDIVMLHRAPIAARYLALACRYNPGTRIVYLADHAQPMNPLEHAVTAAADATLSLLDPDATPLQALIGPA